MSVYKKLQNIQTTLKAPKNLYNSFGKYNYRNCEGILEAVKPLLNQENCVLIISDELVQIHERYYVKAIAKFIDTETNEEVIVSSLARESDSKKGMDESQITGATSSYARKYALNGLFLLDDTKDADDEKSLMNDHNQKQLTSNEKDYRKLLVDYCQKNKIDLNIIASSYNLSRNSTQDDYKKVYEIIKE